jgi:hypothetical protein
MLLLSLAPEAAAVEPFAIACTGKAQFADTLRGERSVREYDVPTQVYVLDEAARRVERAMEPRQQFEDVCFRGGYIDSISFSPGLVSVRSERAGTLCDFQVSRVSGEAVFFSHQDLPGGRYSQMEWRMTCSPAAIPVFDRSRNRF